MFHVVISAVVLLELSVVIHGLIRSSMILLLLVKIVRVELILVKRRSFEVTLIIVKVSEVFEVVIVSSDGCWFGLKKVIGSVSLKFEKLLVLNHS